MAAEHATYASFALAPATRAGAVPAGRAHVTHRDYTDFVVDGRPLLFRLADLDAVSPHAADVPPAVFAEQVRALLLEAPAPLPGGRYLVHGCPACADLACGAVTAVVARDGEDYVWRDFARQTDDHPDLRLNGYRDLGPFRFRGAEYRRTLTGLAARARDAGEEGRRVPLVGARSSSSTSWPPPSLPSGQAPTSPTTRPRRRPMRRPRRCAPKQWWRSHARWGRSGGRRCAPRSGGRGPRWCTSTASPR
jgi:hypothetical protein